MGKIRSLNARYRLLLQCSLPLVTSMITSSPFPSSLLCSSSRPLGHQPPPFNQWRSLNCLSSRAGHWLRAFLFVVISLLLWLCVTGCLFTEPIQPPPHINRLLFSSIQNRILYSHWNVLIVSLFLCGSAFLDSIPTHVVNTFCWISSTFTMPDAFRRQVSSKQSILPEQLISFGKKLGSLSSEIW